MASPKYVNWISLIDNSARTIVEAGDDNNYQLKHMTCGVWTLFTLFNFYIQWSLKMCI